MIKNSKYRTCGVCIQNKYKKYYYKDKKYSTLLKDHKREPCRRLNLFEKFVNSMYIRKGEKSVSEPIDLACREGYDLPGKGNIIHTSYTRFLGEATERGLE